MQRPTGPDWIREEQLDRALGAMIGLAIGDALGTTLEFARRDEKPPVTDIVGGGPFHLRPGQWTDDTAMALALAESLVERRGFDGRDVMKRFVSWWLEGEYSCTGTCFDIGATTKSALGYFQKTGTVLAGSKAPDTAGNGSVMRLAPAVLHGLRSPRTSVMVARQQSSLTHGARACLDGCEAMARIMRGLILREPGAEPVYALPQMPGMDPQIVAVTDGSQFGRPRSEVASSGFVTHTLDAALWSVVETSSFEEALVLAVNLGGDADTVGAVTGQIAGAAYGLSGIPHHWVDRLAWSDRLLRAARLLVERAPARSLAERIFAREDRQTLPA